MAFVDLSEAEKRRQAFEAQQAALTPLQRFSQFATEALPQVQQLSQQFDANKERERSQERERRRQAFNDSLKLTQSGVRADIAAQRSGLTDPSDIAVLEEVQRVAEENRQIKLSESGLKRARQQSKDAVDLASKTGDSEAVISQLNIQDPNTIRLVRDAAERSGQAQDLKRQESAARLKKAQKPTQKEFETATFATRARDAQNIFQDLERKGFDRSSLGTALRSSLPEIAKSDELKSQEQAERNFITAILRRESGAAIAESEFDTAEDLYFPRVGDPPEVVEQKRRSREQVISALEAGSGDALEQIRQQFLSRERQRPQVPQPERSQPSAAASERRRQLEARRQELLRKAGL